MRIAAVDKLGGESHVVVEETRDTGHRRRLAHEERKGELDARARRVEANQQIVDDIAERRNSKWWRADGSALLEQRNQSRHVRALAIVGEGDVDVAGRNRRVHDAVAIHERQWIAQPLDADLIDRDAPFVATRLHIGDRDEDRRLLGAVHGETIA